MMIPRHALIKSLKLALALGAVGALLVMGCGFYLATLRTPPQTVLLNDRHGMFLAEVSLAEVSQDEQQGYGYWPIKELPPRVVAATLAIEDRHFWSHPGIDPIAVGRAMWQNLSSSRRISGASTIAMQLARMQSPGARNYFHKIIEAATALALTWRHGREQVLKHYLRLVPYGNNIHGIAYAARRYLDKPVADLSWAEIAFLSAIPQSPGHMNPYNYKGRLQAIQRGKRILAQLQNQSIISDAELSLALRQIDHIEIPMRLPRPKSAIHAILKLEEQVRQLPENALQQFDAPILNTSLDLDLQERLSAITDAQLEKWRPRGGGNAALIVVDRSDHSVLGWVGSGDYFDDEYSGAIDYARIKRSSGSTLKPFFYALGLDRGDISAATLLDDIPTSALALRNSDMHYLGPVLPRQALANSRNIPMAQIVQRLGLNAGYNFLHTLRLHQEEFPAQHYGLGIALGTLPVSLEDLVTAYTALANDGVLTELNWFSRSSLLVTPGVKRQRVLSSGTARQITLFLSDPSARLPSFPRMGYTEYPFPVAVKTGTSQAYRDAWTIAYSQRYLVGAWIGDPDNRPMNNMGGYNSAAQLVRQALLLLHQKQRKGDHDLSFPKPDGYLKVKLCANSGKLAGDQCDHYFEEWLKPEQVPQQQDLGVQHIMVDRRNGEKATENTPANYRQLRAVLTLPPRYAVWAAQQSGMTTINEDPLMAVNSTYSDTRTNQPIGVNAANRRIELEIQSPRDGVRIIANPEIPEQVSTIELSASVSPALKQITWFVDGKAFKNADYPYNARLPLSRGEHIIQAGVPLTNERSKPVSITVE